MENRKVNLCALEKFYYDAIVDQIGLCKSAIEAYNKFSSPLRLTVRELFSKHLVMEFFGKKYEYPIKDFIYPTADLYGPIYERARERAYIDFLRNYKKPKKLIRFMEKEDKKLITISDAARMLGITENAVRYRVKQGYISTYRNMNGALRVSKEEITEKYLTFKKQ